MSNPVPSVPRGCPLPGGRVLFVEQGRLLIGLIGVVEVRPEEAEQDHADDDQQPGDGQLVLDEDAEDLHTEPTDVGRFTALGLEDQIRPQGLAHPHRDAGRPGIEAGHRVLDEIVIVGHQFPPPNLMRGSATA